MEDFQKYLATYSNEITQEILNLIVVTSETKTSLYDAMEYVIKSQKMHNGPNAFDSMAEHYASLGEYDKAVENQLKAYDYATFTSPYQPKIGEYWRKANKNQLIKDIEKLQSDMQDAILKADKEAFKKFTHPDLSLIHI